MRSLLAALFLAGLGGPVRAETFDIDRDHSSVAFKVAHLVVSKTNGEFETFKGTFDYDPADPKSWKAEASIEAASIDTKVAARDKHLRSADFLDVEKCPEIKFVSANVTNVKKGSFKLWGDLTLRCTTKRVALDVETRGEVEDPWGNTRTGFSATTKLDRFEYGVAWNKENKSGQAMVGKDIEVSLEIEGIKRKMEKVDAEAKKPEPKKEKQAK